MPSVNATIQAPDLPVTADLVRTDQAGDLFPNHIHVINIPCNVIVP